MAGMGPRSVSRARLGFVLAALAVFPDLDVVAFRLGIPYSHWLGHRGISHSPIVALLVGALVARVAFRRVPFPSKDGWRLVALCPAAMASHGVLDAFTNGGLGVAFLLPFSPERFFFPFRPLVVSPIGVGSFLRGPAFAVLGSEVLWVWIPVFGVLALASVLGRRSRRAT